MTPERPQPPSPEDPPAPLRTGLEAPIRHSGRPGRDVPLVFADSAADAPDLSALAQRVAGKVAAPSAVPPLATACFGAEQRWYLTRLALPPATDRPRLVVRSDRFIGADLLEAWATRPPPEAVPLAYDVAAVVDGITPVGKVAFYALLEGPAPWQVLPLSPLAPPFDVDGRVAALGEAGARLEALLAEQAAGPSPPEPLRALLAAAVAWLPADHPARARLKELS